MGTVLQGGTVVTAADTYQADVRMEEGKVVAVGRRIIEDGDTVLDVNGCYLFPGGIDPHTHFDLPIGIMRTADDFASGTRAALLGGTTTVIDYATQFRGETLRQGLQNWHDRAEGQAYTDYGFHLAVTDWTDTVAADMADLARCDGITSFKLYMAYKNVLQVPDSVLFAAFRQAALCGALICLHCENGDVIDVLVREALEQGRNAPVNHALCRPEAAEEEATRRAILLAGLAKARLYIVHLTCGGALEAVRKARAAGQSVWAETCPQYLLLDDTYYAGGGFEGAKYVISPPLRNKKNQSLLWRGLADGTVATVATDHCSFNFSGQKDTGRHNFSMIPNGMPGVETRLGLLFTYGVGQGHISLNQFVALTSTNAARLFGLYPQKGTIAVGSDADITVWNPQDEILITAAAQSQRVDYSPFEGFRQQGRAEHVFLRGRQVVDHGILVVPQPYGRFIPRQTFVSGGC